MIRVAFVGVDRFCAEFVVEDLKEYLAEWVQEALQTLSQFAFPFAQYEDTRITLNPDGGWSSFPMPRLDFDFHLAMGRETLLGIPSAQAVRGAASQASEFADAFKTGPSNGADSLNNQETPIASILIRMLAAYLDGAHNVSWSPERFDLLFNDLMRYLRGESAVGKWTIEFINGGLDAEVIDMEPGVSLRHCSDSEKSESLRRQLGYPRKAFDDLFARPTAVMIPEVPTDVLSIEQSIDPREQPRIEEARIIASSTVLTLRLLAPDELYFGPMVYHVQDQPFSKFRNLTVHLEGSAPALKAKRFHLGQRGAQSLPGLYSSVRRRISDPDISTSVSRFTESYFKAKLEDQLIDYWIALEALFLPEDYLRDMAETIALAASYYVGQSDRQRKSLYQLVKRSHSLRSFIIHGSRGTAKQSLDEIVPKTGDLLRESLRRRILEPRS